MVIGEESPQCEIKYVGKELEKVSQFKFLCCILGEKGAYNTDSCRKIASGRKVADTNKSFVNRR